MAFAILFPMRAPSFALAFQPRSSRFHGEEVLTGVDGTLLLWRDSIRDHLRGGDCHCQQIPSRFSSFPRTMAHILADCLGDHDPGRYRCGEPDPLARFSFRSQRLRCWRGLRQTLRQHTSSRESNRSAATRAASRPHRCEVVRARDPATCGIYAKLCAKAGSELISPLSRAKNV